jgi:hypothetical protein
LGSKSHRLRGNLAKTIEPRYLSFFCDRFKKLYANDCAPSALGEAMQDPLKRIVRKSPACASVKMVYGGMSADQAFTEKLSMFVRFARSVAKLLRFRKSER